MEANRGDAVRASREGALAVGVDMGGTRIKVGLVGATGRVVARDEVRASPQQPFVTQMSAVAGKVDSLLADSGVKRGSLRGLALGFPGIIDSTTRQVLSAGANKYPDAVGWDFAAWSRDELGLELALEHDTRMALIGERCFGAGRGVSNLVMVTFGTGLGTAVVIGGHVVRGARGRAGILGGHVAVPRASEPCDCGNVGCAEAEASTAYLERLMSHFTECAESQLGEGPIDYAMVARSAAVGDPCAERVLAYSIATWTALVVNLVNLYDPQRIIIGGGIMTHDRQMFARLVASVGACLATITWSPTQAIEFVHSELGDDAALAAAHPLLDETRRFVAEVR